MKLKLLSMIAVLGLIGGIALFNQTPWVSAQTPTLTPTPTITPTLTPSLTITPTPTSVPCTTSFPSGHPQVDLSYTVSSDAAYNVWSRIQGNGSGWVQVDTQCAVLIGNTTDWTWVDYQRDDASKRISYALTTGQHTIKYASESGNFNVDRIILVDDVNCIPTGFGENCDGSPIGPGNPGGPTYACLGACPTLTLIPTIDPNALLLAPGGTAPCGGTGGGGLLGLIIDFIMKLLELLFGGSACTPAPATPTATPSATLTPTGTVSATLTPTITLTVTPTMTITETPTPTP